MRQSYYAVQKKLYDELVINIKDYNDLLKVILNREVQKADRLEAMEEKKLIEDNIRNILNNQGQLLGFFSENDLENYSAAIKLLEDSTKELLEGNCIPLSVFDNILMDIMRHQDNNILKKLSGFFENAKKQDISILVWIM